MFKKLYVAVLVLVMLAGGCAKKVDVAGSQAALRAADQEWTQTVGNVDAFVGYMAPDGSIMPPNEPATTGTESVRAWATQMFGMPGFSVVWTPTQVEVAASGELGYTTGTYRLSMQGPDGAAVNDTGKYLTVWKKDASGAWKVQYDAFNSDIPMPELSPMDTTDVGK